MKVIYIWTGEKDVTMKAGFKLTHDLCNTGAVLYQLN